VVPETAERVTTEAISKSGTPPVTVNAAIGIHGCEDEEDLVGLGVDRLFRELAGEVGVGASGTVGEGQRDAADQVGQRLPKLCAREEAGHCGSRSEWRFLCPTRVETSCKPGFDPNRIA